MSIILTCLFVCLFRYLLAIKSSSSCEISLLSSPPTEEEVKEERKEEIDDEDDESYNENEEEDEDNEENNESEGEKSLNIFENDEKNEIITLNSSNKKEKKKKSKKNNNTKNNKRKSSISELIAKFNKPTPIIVPEKPPTNNNIAKQHSQNLNKTSTVSFESITEINSLKDSFEELSHQESNFVGDCDLEEIENETNIQCLQTEDSHENNIDNTIENINFNSNENNSNINIKENEPFHINKLESFVFEDAEQITNLNTLQTNLDNNNNNEEDQNEEDDDQGDDIDDDISISSTSSKMRSYRHSKSLGERVHGHRLRAPVTVLGRRRSSNEIIDNSSIHESTFESSQQISNSTSTSTSTTPTKPSLSITSSPTKTPPKRDENGLIIPSDELVKYMLLSKQQQQSHNISPLRSQSLPIHLEDNNNGKSEANFEDFEKNHPLPFEAFTKLMESHETLESQIY